MPTSVRICPLRLFITLLVPLSCLLPAVRLLEFFAVNRKDESPSTKTVDLLDSNFFRELTQNPERLVGLIEAVPKVSLVIIDEIQKIPNLLDEVQRLIVSKKKRFGLCGASARKLRRGHPEHYLSENPLLLLRSYISDYLKEEISAEGIVRNLPLYLHLTFNIT